MIKYLFILINSFALFLYGLLDGDAVITIKNNFPSTITAGQEVAVELTLNKGSMDGFAKLQLDLPEGIALKQAEDKGATYTNSEGIVKWVWATLPAEEEIVVKMVLAVSENAQGPKTITAKFSYVEDNEKKVVEMQPKEITITPSENKKEIPSETSVKQEAKKEIDSTSKMPSNNSASAEPLFNINVIRTISAGASANEHIINLKITKASSKGFARYSDDIAPGLIAKAIKTDGSSFSVSDGKIKFVWVNVPEKEELEVSYSLKSSTKNTIMLQGEYSYLENNQSKKFVLPKDSIIFTEPLKSIDKKLPVDTQKVVSVPKKITEPVEKKEGNPSFVVQIGAFTNAKVSAVKLKQKFKITETVKSEMHEGFFKFLIGSHLLYKDARDHKEVVKNVNGIKSAFVAAYAYGKRITVQEALMVSNQKWYK